MFHHHTTITIATTTTTITTTTTTVNDHVATVVETKASAPRPFTGPSSLPPLSSLRVDLSGWDYKGEQADYRFVPAIRYRSPLSTLH